MAVIPYQGLPQVAPSGQGAPMPQITPVSGYGALTQGAQQFGQGLGDAITGGLKAQAKESAASYQKATEAESVEGETELTRYGTEELHGSQGSGDQRRDDIEAAFNGEPTEKPGYLNLQGDDAFKESTPTFDRIKQRRERIAGEMTTDDARERFLQRTAPQLESYYATIETHAGRQRVVADEASLKARQGAALEAIRADPNNWVQATQQTAALEESIRILGLSGPDKQARVEEWRRQAAVAQVLAQLKTREGQPPDWQSAEKTLESKRATIGSEAAGKLEEQIRKAKGDSVAEVKAQAIVETSRTQGGQVDAAKALELVDQVPPGNERDEVRQRVHARLVQAEQMRRQERDEIARVAEATYNDVGWGRMPVALKERLNEVDPPKYRQLRDESERKWRQLNTDHGQLRREQAEANKVLLDEFMALSPEQRKDADTGAFLAEFKRNNPELPVTLTGASALDRRRRQAQDLWDKGHAVKESQFLLDAKANAGFLDSKKKLKQFESEAAIAFGDFVADNKRPPNDEEAKRIIATMRIKRDSKPGLLYGLNPEYEFERRTRARKAEAEATEGALVLPSMDFSGPSSSTPAPPEIPAEERTKVVAALKKRGLVVTEEAVQALYRQVHGGE